MLSAFILYIFFLSTYNEPEILIQYKIEHYLMNPLKTVFTSSGHPWISLVNYLMNLLHVL